MDTQEAKRLIDEIFYRIKNSNTIDDLENILENSGIPEKNKMNSISYPKIEFQIDSTEIESLIETGFITPNLEFAQQITSRITDPLTKLLYSIVWKNGDLKKEKHIIKGIKSINEDIEAIDNGIVFYQFGKFLTKTPGEPIIDQHVIRAFLVNKSYDLNEIEIHRKLKTISALHFEVISEYKDWLLSNELQRDLRQSPEYTFYIDKILFAAGKTIKSKDDN